MLSAISTATSDTEPTDPQAGQRVPPRWGGPGGISSSPEKVRLSLYEYSDGQQHIITGQSITFLMPKFFMTMTDNQHGGAQSSIVLRFNPETGGPHIPESYPNEASFERDRFNQLGIFLTTAPISQFTSDKTLITERGFYPKAMNMWRSSRLKLMDNKHCGFDVYRPEAPQPIDMRRFPKSVEWPFSHPVVFARPLPGNRLEPVISCSDIPNLYGFPQCTLNGLYRGWPMSLNFSANTLCKGDVLAKARGFLDQYKISETQRSPGQKEHRYKPPRPDANRIPY